MTALAPRSDLIVWDGQSLANFPGPATAYPALVNATRTGLLGPVEARDGTTWATRALTAARRVDQHPYTVSGLRALGDCGGTSEVASGTAAADILASATGYWADRLAAGFDVVVAATITPSTVFDPGDEAERLAFNDLLRNLVMAGVTVCDLAAVPILADPAGPGYDDGTHFSVAGAADAASVAWEPAMAAVGI